MPGRFEELTQLCVLQAKSLREFVGGLPPEAWNVQSACSEWQVGDVVSHLASAAHMFSGLLTAMAKGTSPSTEWRMANPDRQGQVADDAKAFRRKLGDEGLRRHFLEGNQRLQESLRSLKEEDADKTSPAAWGGRRTVYQVVGVVIGEMALHRWDMESRLKKDATFAPEVLKVLMGYLAGWRMVSFQKGQPRSPVHYRWETSRPSAAQWDLVVRGDSFEHVRGSQDKPDVVFRTDPASYVLIGVGRLDMGEAIAKGRVRPEGPRELVEAYPRYFRSV